jgi:hypothetical protein
MGLLGNGQGLARFADPHLSRCVGSDIYILTNTQEVPTHSAAPSKCIHSSNPKSYKDETGTDRQDITEIQTSQAGTLQQPMLICGHTHASPESRPTGLGKHTQTCTVHEKAGDTDIIYKIK